jgi:glutamine synthetase
MHSRYDIGLEQYAMSVNVEARLTFEMGKTMVLPAALRYQTEVALNVGALIAAQVPADPSTLEPVSGRLAALRIALAALGEAVAGGSRAGCARRSAVRARLPHPRHRSGA